MGSRGMQRGTGWFLLMVLALAASCGRAPSTVGSSSASPARSASPSPQATPAVCPSSDRPSARGYPASAFDAATGTIVVFGGNAASTNAPLNDTWTWKSGCWTELSPAQSPTPRTAMVATYDPTSHWVIAYGGAIGQPGQSGGFVFDTWAWNGVTWSKVADSGPQLVAPAIAYDPATKTVIMFGAGTGYEASGQTWSWTGSAWQQLHPSLAPAPRTAAGLSSDVNDRGLVLFGGTRPPTLNDTWTWDGTTWTEQHSTASPPARHNAGIALDRAHQRVILVGGLSSDSKFDDTWLWDGNQWAQQTSAYAGFAVGPVGLLDSGTQLLLVDTSQEVRAWSGADWTGAM